jgi:hypothetical protein
MLIKIYTSVACLLSCKKIGYLIFCVVCMGGHELMAMCRHCPCIKLDRNFLNSPI